MNDPAVVITVRIERAPLARLIAVTAGDEARLLADLERREFSQELLDAIDALLVDMRSRCRDLMPADLGKGS